MAWHNRTHLIMAINKIFFKKKSEKKNQKQNPAPNYDDIRLIRTNPHMNVARQQSFPSPGQKGPLSLTVRG